MELAFTEYLIWHLMCYGALAGLVLVILSLFSEIRRKEYRFWRVVGAVAISLLVTAIVCLAVWVAMFLLLPSAEAILPADPAVLAKQTRMDALQFLLMFILPIILGGMLLLALGRLVWRGDFGGLLIKFSLVFMLAACFICTRSAMVYDSYLVHALLFT